MMRPENGDIPHLVVLAPDSDCGRRFRWMGIVWSQGVSRPATCGSTAQALAGPTLRCSGAEMRCSEASTKRLGEDKPWMH